MSLFQWRRNLNLKKEEKVQTNNLILSLKQSDKEEQTKPKISRRKEIIKIRAEINEIETKNKEQCNENLVLWKDQQNGSTSSQTQQEKKQIHKIRNEKGEITTDSTEIQRIIRDYKQIYDNKMANKKWTDSFKGTTYQYWASFMHFNG